MREEMGLDWVDILYSEDSYPMTYFDQANEAAEAKNEGISPDSLESGRPPFRASFLTCHVHLTCHVTRGNLTVRNAVC